MNPEEAAAITSVEQLPDHLRAPARKILRQYAKSMAAAGYPPDHVASDVGHLLLGIAYFERVPESLDEVQSFPWDNNHNRRRDLQDEPGRFGEAMRLRRERQARESEAAP